MTINDPLRNRFKGIIGVILEAWLRLGCRETWRLKVRGSVTISRGGSISLRQMFGREYTLS